PTDHQREDRKSNVTRQRHDPVATYRHQPDHRPHGAPRDFRYRPRCPHQDEYQPQYRTAADHHTTRYQRDHVGFYERPDRQSVTLDYRYREDRTQQHDFGDYQHPEGYPPLSHDPAQYTYPRGPDTECTQRTGRSQHVQRGVSPDAKGDGFYSFGHAHPGVNFASAATHPEQVTEGHTKERAVRMALEQLLRSLAYSDLPRADVMRVTDRE
ncbi:hypothetical protein BaRGS_00018748, partial [Batillaria attramentaria]